MFASVECPESSTVSAGTKTAVVENQTVAFNATEENLGSTALPTSETEENLSTAPHSNNETENSGTTEGYWVSGNNSTNHTCGEDTGGCQPQVLLIATYALLATFAALIPVVMITVKVTLWVYRPTRSSDAKSPDETKPIAAGAEQPPNYTE